MTRSEITRVVSEALAPGGQEQTLFEGLNLVSQGCIVRNEWYSGSLWREPPETHASHSNAGIAAALRPATCLAGDSKPGLGYAIAKAVASAGGNLAFFAAHIIGGRYSAVAGFESEGDANNAVPLIEPALAPKRR